MYVQHPSKVFPSFHVRETTASGNVLVVVNDRSVSALCFARRHTSRSVCVCACVLQVLIKTGWQACKTRRFEWLVGKRGRMDHGRKWRLQLDQPWVLNSLVLLVACGDRDH